MPTIAEVEPKFSPRLRPCRMNAYSQSLVHRAHSKMVKILFEHNPKITYSKRAHSIMSPFEVSNRAHYIHTEPIRNRVHLCCLYSKEVTFCLVHIPRRANFVLSTFQTGHFTFEITPKRALSKLCTVYFDHIFFQKILSLLFCFSFTQLQLLI